MAVMHQVVTAQLAARPVRDRFDEDDVGGSRRWREAVAAEGNGARPSWLDPQPDLGRRRLCVRPQTP